MNKINGADLIAIGYHEGKILGLALEVTATHYQDHPREQLLELMRTVKEKPETFLDDEVLEELATKIIEEANAPVDDTIQLKQTAGTFVVYGADHIDEGTRKQMNIAMKLPVTAGGALMPDAHQGYGLPIGGVLATKNAVIPYGVGVDIGCRMALSIFDIPEEHFYANHDIYKRELVAHTRFGAGHGYHGKERTEHAVLDREEFNLNQQIRQLQDKAYSQLGTSGGGNHFVEWGIIEFTEDDKPLNIPKGKYLALLSHSGSRGFGATIAGYYTKLAKQLCKLPQEAANLAYLDLDTAEGQEYWLAMNLAGDYAAACHEVIHNKLAKAIGGNLLAKVENHHNFAWKENWNGENVIVHRKGATPASKDVMGIIPGSMTAPGFLVRGKGEAAAINSASHGAGRQLSRTKAIQQISKEDMKAILAANNVTLIGAGLDEAPMAYKDINIVMEAQKDLVDIIAKFSPKMVRMADDGSKED
ncbi:RtcB family protein [Chitinophaga tropicalis]|uniref:3'-phosphate/5'-hydroxy nucleic acid ligase n=1 Tax=Chitinophaga tropicalis TaxID=2683588 RepID=A0A7K1U899_9BACT|nr:RtcB family protein [Chitinophaga tropicalis]MVT10607.1 RtcB family protein [Chitinophaga tropicalis]